jgi:hypothetical protein
VRRGFIDSYRLAGVFPTMTHATCQVVSFATAMHQAPPLAQRLALHMTPRNVGRAVIGVGLFFLGALVVVFILGLHSAGQRLQTVNFSRLTPQAKTVQIEIRAIQALARLSANNSARQSTQPALPPEQIALHEAEILIYLLPEAQLLRNQGMDIGWEQTDPKLNQQDFYTFWVYNSKRPTENGSVTVGHFSVNKHTAEVWGDDNEKPISTNDLEGIERILRRAHHIDESTVRKFGSIRPPR